MGLGEMLEEMNKNRPQPGPHFNGLSPTGRGLIAQAKASWWARQKAAAANDAMAAAAREIANAQVNLQTMPLNQLGDLAARLRREIIQDAQCAELVAAGILSPKRGAEALVANRLRDAVGAPPQIEVSDAEVRKLACDRMGETRCSVPCYSARRHVEKAPKKSKEWERPQDDLASPAMPFWLVKGEKQNTRSTVAMETSVPSGSLVERANAHLRPRWKNAELRAELRAKLPG